MRSDNTAVRALRSAGVCEVVWVRPDGGLDATAATPLVLAGRAALAFPYSNAALARSLGTARSAAVVLSDRRVSGASWRPLGLVGTPRLSEDRDGERFCAELLTQELAKHPPSRALIDSILLRREHWWFVPRLIVTLERAGAIEVAERTGGEATGVLGVLDRDGRPRIATTTAGADGTHTVADTGRPPPEPAESAEAVLIRHDFSVPDLERWHVATTPGSLSGTTFRPAEPLADITVAGPLGLLARMRRQRDLGRACRRELDRAPAG